MKTNRGSCKHRVNATRLDTELVKKLKDLLEHGAEHEMLHLIEPAHSERFLALMTRHVPHWREARLELNDLPLSGEEWTSYALFGTRHARWLGPIERFVGGLRAKVAVVGLQIVPVRHDVALDHAEFALGRGQLVARRPHVACIDP
jgi:metallopeptidase YgjP-like protein